MEAHQLRWSRTVLGWVVFSLWRNQVSSIVGGEREKLGMRRPGAESEWRHIFSFFFCTGYHRDIQRCLLLEAQTETEEWWYIWKSVVGQGSPLLNYTSIRDATPGCASLWREGSSPPEDPRSSLCNGLGLVFGWLVLDRIWGSWRWASTPYPPAHTSKCPASHRFSLVLLR